MSSCSLTMMKTGHSHPADPLFCDPGQHRPAQQKFSMAKHLLRTHVMINARVSFATLRATHCCCAPGQARSIPQDLEFPTHFSLQLRHTQPGAHTASACGPGSLVLCCCRCWDASQPNVSRKMKDLMYVEADVRALGFLP